MATKSKKTAAKKATKTKKVAKVASKSASSAKKASAKKVDKKVVSKKVAVKVASKASKKAAPKKGFLNKLVDKLSAKKAESKVSAAVKSKTKAGVAEVKKIVKEKVVPVAKEKTNVEKVSSAKPEAQVKKEAKNTSQNIADLTQDFAEKKLSTSAAEVLLTDAEGRVLCKYSGCDELANVEGYCRYHYLLNWKRIQLKKKILSEGKLDKYINELTARYPDKYIEMLKGDLKSEKDFISVVNELEIDDSDSSISEDDDDGFDEVQGVAGSKRSSDEDY